LLRLFYDHALVIVELRNGPGKFPGCTRQVEFPDNKAILVGGWNSRRVITRIKELSFDPGIPEKFKIPADIFIGRAVNPYTNT
jgi:hypothetical protein